MLTSSTSPFVSLLLVLTPAQKPPAVLAKTRSTSGTAMIIIKLLSTIPFLDAREGTPVGVALSVLTILTVLTILAVLTTLTILATLTLLSMLSVLFVLSLSSDIEVARPGGTFVLAVMVGAISITVVVTFEEVSAPMVTKASFRVKPRPLSQQSVVF
jgi:hypothetical protein